MRVKLAKLKTHLSRYLRELESNREPLEVCVREKTVAYLTPATTSGNESGNHLRSLAQEAGLKLVAARSTPASIPLDSPAAAGDGRTDINSTGAMRHCREW